MAAADRIITAMITVADIGEGSVSWDQVKATGVLVSATAGEHGVIRAWMTQHLGAAWIIGTTAERAAGLRATLAGIWEGEPAEVQWWSPMPVPDAVHVPGAERTAGEPQT